jgi:hypothetical protein
MVVLAGRVHEPIPTHPGGTIFAAIVRADENSPNLAAFLSPEFHSDQNGLPTANLESTNGLLSPSSKGLFRPTATSK